MNSFMDVATTLLAGFINASLDGVAMTIRFGIPLFTFMIAFFLLLSVM